ncbi:hypothetical protein AB0C81_01610 [Streptomyces roseoverticillatus]|uniref:hypothetical protein n=1 Tax=Streptomyces roseoverticillatus TaxID=66429 RepID=UPI003407B33C
MALPKKGSRRIVVDGTAYRWRLRGRPTYDQGMGWSPMTYAVEHLENPGTTLLVDTGGPHTRNWMGAPSAPVLPSAVAEAVRTARTRGWEPAIPGAPFRLDLLEPST